MRRFHIATALLPVALLFSQAAVAQDQQRPTRQNASGSSDLQMVENDLTLNGPDGRNALQVTKSTPREVRAGQQFDYQITVRNSGDSTLQNVVVVEQVDGLEVRNAQGPARRGNAQKRQSQRQNRQGQKAKNPQNNTQENQNASAQQPKGRNQSQGDPNQADQNQQRVQQQGNTVRYRIGKLEGGQSRTLTVSAVANDSGQAHSCMWVDFQPTLCTSINVVQPDFRLVGRLLFDRAIETRGDIEGIYKCDDLKLELALTSTGDAATQPAQAAVQLPKGLTTQDGKNEVQVDLGRVEPNKTVRKDIQLKLDPQHAGDQVKLQAHATAGDLQAQVQLPAVKILDPQLKVSVDAPEQAYINKPVEMSVTVENPSEDPVLDTVVQIQGPAGAEQFTIEGAEAGRDGTIEIGRLDGGGSKEFTVRMQANQPATANVMVSAEGYCAQAKQQKAQIALKGIPAVLIEVVDKVDPVPVGETTVYEISVKNQGTERDTNLQLSATLPDSMEFIRGDGETKVNADGKNLNFGQLKEIAPGDVVSWTIQARATKTDKARLKVELKSEATEEPVTEQEPTTLYGDSPQGDNQSDQKQAGNQNKDSGNQ